MNQAVIVRWLQAAFFMTAGVFVCWVGNAQEDQLVAKLDGRLRSLERSGSDLATRQAMQREIFEARQRLTTSIEQGEVALLRREMAAGLRMGTTESWRLISTAMCSGNLRGAELLLGPENGPFDHNHAGRAWHCVVQSGKVELAELLLRRAGPRSHWNRAAAEIAIRANMISLFAFSQGPALVEAVRGKRFDVAESLAGAFDADTDFESRSLISLFENDESDSLRRLLKFDAVSTKLDTNASSALLSAAVRARASECSEILQ